MRAEQLTEEHVRTIRAIYDRLSLGERAVLKRCRDADEIAMEGAFWRVVRGAPEGARGRLAEVVVCFPAAEQPKRTGGFSPGSHLYRALLGNRRTLSDAGALRFRQLLQARDRGELVHRLRRLLAFANARVDWGVLGMDIFYWGNRVRRQWAQDFYSNTKGVANG